MGRPKKYNTDEERRQAARERAKRSRELKRFDILRIGLNVLPNTHMQVPHDVRAEAHDMVYGPSVDLYTRKPRVMRDKFLNAKKQIASAMKCIKSKKHNGVRKFSFNWNGMNENEQNYMFAKLGDVLKAWSKVNFVDSKWLVRYKFTNKAVVTKPMNDETATHLISQLAKEGFINSVTDEMADYEASDYDYFPTGIKTLEMLEFINADYDSLVKRKRREGGFWRWILKVPIDLSEYQIFNRLNKHTIEQMTRDNCIIYACIKSGLDESIIKHMRQVFKNRFISITKIDSIGKECGIKFYIRNSDTLIVGDKSSSIEVKLVLINGHYMIDKDIALSPYYIRHYKEITKDSRALAMPFERRCLVSNVKLGVTSNAYDIVEVLNALFDINAFQPITQSDLMRYKTTLYQDVPEDTEAVEYDERYCCRLKAPRIYKKQ